MRCLYYERQKNQFFPTQERKTDSFNNDGSQWSEKRHRLFEFRYHGEFDSGSELTLAARLKHASRTIALELA